MAATFKPDMEVVLDLEKKFKKGDKKPKDTNAPKAPLTAFMAWSQDNRKRVTEAHPTATLGEIAKVLGAEWTTLDPSIKKPYQEKAEADRKQHNAKLEKYKKTRNYRDHQHQLLAWKIHETKKPFKTDPNAPKRATSAWMIYVNTQRDKVKATNPDLRLTEVTSQLSQMWKSLSADDKVHYEEKSKLQREEYKKALEIYAQTNEYKTYQAAKLEYREKMTAKRQKLKGIKKKKKKASKPKKKSVSRSRSKSVRRRKNKKSKKSGKRRGVQRRTKKGKSSRRRDRSRSSSASSRASRSSRSSTPKRRRRRRKAKSKKSKASKKRRAVRRTKRANGRGPRRARKPKQPRSDSSDQGSEMDTDSN